ncbi:unnamed protein product [Gordionus sp. m RMFG-2023]
MFMLDTQLPILNCYVIGFLCLQFTFASEEEGRLIRDLFRNYNKLIRPVRNRTEHLNVQFGLSLIQLINVNEREQIMKTNVWLQLKWKDYQLAWSTTDYGNIKNIQIPYSMIWTPDIVLLNNADGKYEVSTKCNVVLNNEGEVLWVPPSIYKSGCIIDVKYFPFDEQQCKMKFGSWTFNGDEVGISFFDSKDYIDLTDFSISGTWDVINVPGYLNVNNRTKPTVTDITFYLYIRRKTLFYTMNLLAPCIMMSMLSVLVFYLPPDGNEKITLGISILLAIVLFQLVVSRLLPPTSLTIPLIAKYLLFTFVMNLICVLLTVIIVNWNFRAAKTHQLPNWLRIIFVDVLPKFVFMKRPVLLRPSKSGTYSFDSSDISSHKEKFSPTSSNYRSYISSNYDKCDLIKNDSNISNKDKRKRYQTCKSISNIYVTTNLEGKSHENKYYTIDDTSQFQIKSNVIDKKFPIYHVHTPDLKYKVSDYYKTQIKADMYNNSECDHIHKHLYTTVKKTGRSSPQNVDKSLSSKLTSINKHKHPLKSINFPTSKKKFNNMAKINLLKSRDSSLELSDFHKNVLNYRFATGANGQLIKQEIDTGVSKHLNYENLRIQNQQHFLTDRDLKEIEEIAKIEEEENDSNMTFKDSNNHNYQMNSSSIDLNVFTKSDSFQKPASKHASSYSRTKVIKHISPRRQYCNSSLTKGIIIRQNSIDIETEDEENYKIKNDKILLPNISYISVGDQYKNNSDGSGDHIYFSANKNNNNNQDLENKNDELNKEWGYRNDHFPIDNNVHMNNTFVTFSSNQQRLKLTPTEYQSYLTKSKHKNAAPSKILNANNYGKFGDTTIHKSDKKLYVQKNPNKAQNQPTTSRLSNHDMHSNNIKSVTKQLKDSNKFSQFYQSKQSNRHASFPPRIMNGTAKDVIFIAKHLKIQDENNIEREDWKYIAIVIDRILLYIFIIVTLGGTLGIIIDAPHIFEHVDQQERILFLTKRT